MSIQGTFGTGTHDVAVTFLDAWSGPGQDRNLYVDGLSVNGTATAGAALTGYGTQHFSVTNTAVSLGSGSDRIVLNANTIGVGA